MTSVSEKKIYLECTLATLGDCCVAGRQSPTYGTLAYLPPCHCSVFPMHQQLPASCCRQVCSRPWRQVGSEAPRAALMHGGDGCEVLRNCSGCVQRVPGRWSPSLTSGNLLPAAFIDLPPFSASLFLTELSEVTLQSTICNLNLPQRLL